MSEFHRVKVRQKFYLDSVALMRFSKSLVSAQGVSEAAMMMGTPSNIEIMANAGLLKADELSAAPGDLIIGIRGVDETSVNLAMSAADNMLDTPAESTAGAQWRPRSVRSAMSLQPDANLALVSVPGAFAISEARKALRRGLHVMIFSDNVPIEQEVELKQEARRLGKLVMGPDCGTAIINGVPLAFANKVPRGDISVIGASGTGIQEITSLIAQNQRGISQAIGVGGRDLQEVVGGISTLMAMEALEKDKHTNHIVLVSKPPSELVAARVLNKASESAKPYTICFLGGVAPVLSENCGWAATLTDAAAHALGKLSLNPVEQPAFNANQRKGKLLHGLFCGGTLCTESLVLFQQAGVPVSSNVKMKGVATDNPDTHRLIDLGADEFTQGKPHPMIEPSIRDEAVQAALADNRVGVLLVDMVIGYGAHADPASHFVASLNNHRHADVDIVASVTGTDDDPQHRARQMSILSEAGVIVASSNAAATSLALSSIGAS